MINMSAKPFAWRQEKSNAPLSNTLPVVNQEQAPQNVVLPQQQAPLAQRMAEGVGTSVVDQALKEGTDSLSNMGAEQYAAALGESASSEAGSQAAMLAAQTGDMGVEALNKTAEAAGQSMQFAGPLAAGLTGVIQGKYGKGAGAAAGATLGASMGPLGSMIGSRLGGQLGSAVTGSK